MHRNGRFDCFLDNGISESTLDLDKAALHKMKLYKRIGSH